MKTRSKTQNQRNVLKDAHYNSEDSQEYASTIISHDDKLMDGLANRKRFRKNDDQVKILLHEFNENPYWTKEIVTELAEKTGLSEAQVYKWNWDYRKKIRKSERLPCDNKFMCKETMMPSRLDADLAKMQRLYKLSFSSLPFATPSRFLFTEL